MKPSDTPSFGPTDAAVRLCVRFDLPTYQCEAVLEMFDGNERYATMWLTVVVEDILRRQQFEADVLERLGRLERKTSSKEAVMLKGVPFEEPLTLEPGQVALRVVWCEEDPK